MILQQTRFENKFDFEINISPNNEQVDDIYIPSLLLQPLVENAIAHGLFHKEEKGNLIIQFNIDKEKNKVVCIIEDDGIGLDA